MRNNQTIVHQIIKQQMKVDEGFVGLYWRGGALLNSISGPGFHFQIPFLTYFEQIQISVQTDKVTDIPVSLQLNDCIMLTL